MEQTLVILSILFVASLIKATIGFGESLFAMPLLSLFMGVQTASPLTALAAATLTAFILLTGWKRIDIKAAWTFILSATLGTPLGVWGLKSLPSHWLTGILGIVLMIAGLYNLIQPKTGSSKSAYWGFLLGFVAGMLGGAYNISGPPTVLYGSIKRWSPEEFRVTLQGLFLPVTIVKLFSQGMAGLWTREVLTYYAFAFPLLLMAFWVGHHIHRKVPEKQLGMILHVTIVVFGGILLVRSFLNA